MKLHEVLIKLLTKKSGVDVTTPVGADFLCRDILSVTGEQLSLNTVKRLTGVILYPGGNPRSSTLDILARYLGYSDWKVLESELQDKISNFNNTDGFIDLHMLPAGQKLAVKWEPGRELIIQHIADSQYIVNDAINSKVLKGDVLTMSQIAVGFPLIVSRLIRNDVDMGTYSAAMTEGLTSIKFINE